MVRPKIYLTGSEKLTISIEKEVLEVLKKRAKFQDKSMSSFISLILKAAVFNDTDYCTLMAKHYNRHMQYWISEKERLKIDREIKQ